MCAIIVSVVQKLVHQVIHSKLLRKRLLFSKYNFTHTNNYGKQGRPSQPSVVGEAVAMHSCTTSQNRMG